MADSPLIIKSKEFALQIIKVCNYRVIKFKTPKQKSVLVRGRIFVCIIHYSFFIIHYSLSENGFSNE